LEDAQASWLKVSLSWHNTFWQSNKFRNEKNLVFSLYFMLCNVSIMVMHSLPCQWASSRPDIFGEAFCARFSQLQDNTTPHSWEHTKRIMREAYGIDWEQKIQLNELLGSGCIGQGLSYIP
jgi:hypothetical protein